MRALSDVSRIRFASSGAQLYEVRRAWDGIIELKSFSSRIFSRSVKNNFRGAVYGVSGYLDSITGKLSDP